MDSPDNTNQQNFELSEFFEFVKWEDEDPPLLVSGYPQNPVYAASEVNDAGSGSSRHLDGPSSSKNLQIFKHCLC